MRRLVAVYASTLALLACSAAPPRAQPPARSAPPAASPVSARETLARDDERTTPEGVRFVAPRGFSLFTDSPSTILEGPDQDLRVALVDVPEAASAEAAVAGAWVTFEPSFTRTRERATPQRGRHGWEEDVHFTYRSSPEERLVLRAEARRRGTRWTVLLVNATVASFEKRAASIKLVTESLRPPGYVRESFAGRTPRPLTGERLDALKRFVEAARVEAGVPGVAVSLFTADRVLLEQGFGVRELGKPEPVDDETRFLIASNTKGLTTLLLAMLVDDKKLGWDTRAVDVYPAFKLGDPATTQRVLMKHLVCACTGLPRQDLEWLLGVERASPASIMGLLGTMQPTSAFGETYQYSNVLAAAAGFVTASAIYPGRELGAAYDRAMAERVLGPLGMQRTTFDFDEALRGDHASPHVEDRDGQPVVASVAVDRAIVPLRPAGGAWSTAADLRRYVQLELAKGLLPSGKRLVSEEALLARRAPQVTIGEGETYGMGLRVNTEYGVPYVHHGGGLVGYKSDLFWLPDAGIGGVVLTSSNSGWLLLKPFIRRTFELLFDGAPEAVEDVAWAARQRREAHAEDMRVEKLPAAPAVTARLAKRYTNPVLGSVKVATDASGTTFDVGAWKSRVASQENADGTTTLLTADPGLEGFDFQVKDDAGTVRLVLRDAQHAYVFDPAP